MIVRLLLRCFARQLCLQRCVSGALFVWFTRLSSLPLGLLGPALSHLLPRDSRGLWTKRDHTGARHHCPQPPPLEAPFNTPSLTFVSFSPSFSTFPLFWQSLDIVATELHAPLWKVWVASHLLYFDTERLHWRLQDKVEAHWREFLSVASATTPRLPHARDDNGYIQHKRIAEALA